MILGQEKLDKMQDILQENLIASGVRSVMLIDTAGNVVTFLNNGDETIDVYALAALAAANFGAMSCMARIIGEDKFTILFHKGEKENIYFCEINEELLLVNIFNNQISLGFLRLKMSRVIEELLSILSV
ncbi:MAG: roadblock/LC7 domain-containing protein [Syntrophaceae bacterium]|jgi:predicted regulator of Ras-like GTPase activity (Roadblock/LC7/MglB family)|nr:roadblock/LC7 domain-containing protein [Syntrophaceae bacterium]HOC61100.1 roadblock/LC7 domain-containing protein [Smithellaceae bacterium]HQM44501.1 roadblock/LC7 domain-containing protein [Smithellaceae bacterium]